MDTKPVVAFLVFLLSILLGTAGSSPSTIQKLQKYQQGNNRVSWTPPSAGRFFNPLVLPWGFGYLSMLLPTSTRTVTSVTLITLYDTVTPYCIHGPADVCPDRKRRAISLDDDDDEQQQPFSPSQVARMAITEMPSIEREKRDETAGFLIGSSRAEDGGGREGRARPYNEWFFVTTSTATLTAATIITAFHPSVSTISLSGACIPRCLVTFPAC